MNRFDASELLSADSASAPNNPATTDPLAPPGFSEDVQSGLITLSYTDIDGDLATSCTLANLNQVTVTQACACAAGVCTVRVTGVANYSGAASFDYTVTTNGQVSSASTATLTITAVNDTPVLSALSSESTYGNLAITKNFTISDVETAVACNSTYLSLSSNATGLIPNANVVWSGTAPNCVATITPADAHTAGGSATLTITLTDGALNVAQAFIASVKPLVLSLPISSFSALIGDYDLDGNNDIAIGANASGAYTNGLISLFYGNGDSTFDSPVDITTSANSNNRKMRQADMNNDGRLDLILNGSSSLNILYNDGAPRTFVTPATAITKTAGYSSSFEHFVTVDYNHDAKQDLVFGLTYAASASNNLTLKLHDGTTAYAAGNWENSASETVIGAPSKFGHHLTAADLNGDTHVDLILTTDTEVRIFWGDGTESVSGSKDYTSPSGAGATECVEFGDVDADGDFDLFVSYWAAPYMTLYKNNGTGKFTAFHYDLPTDKNEACAVADMDLDGRSDFIIGSDNGWLAVLYATSSGTLDDVAPSVYDFTEVMMPARPAVGDLNNDGCPDLATAASWSSSPRTQLLYNRGSDGNGGCLKTFWGIQTTPNPNAPVLGGIGGQFTYGSVPLVRSFSLTDADSSVACNSTNLSMVSSNTGLIANANVTWGGTAPNCTATVWASSATTSGGMASLTVTATDGTLTDTESFTVWVRRQTLNAAINTTSSAVTDLDLDGNPDVVIGSNPGGAFAQGLITVYYGNADGTFSSATQITDAATLYSGGRLRVADMNNDGAPDIVSTAGNRFRITYNNGAARTFNSTIETVLVDTTNFDQFYDQFEILDFNQDGRMDLFYGVNRTVSASNGWKLRLHDGSNSYAGANWGTTATEIDVPDPGQWGQDVSSADLNGDTRRDLITSTMDQVIVRFGDGTNAFSSSTTVISGAWPTDVIECAAAGDVDGDGDSDVFVSYWNTAKVTLLRNSGSGTFVSQDYAVSTTKNEACAARDIDGDGYADFVIGSQDNAMTVLYANGTGGLDAAGAVTVDFTISTYPSTPGIGDLNGDGCLDLAFSPRGTATRTQLMFSTGPNASGQCQRGFYGL